MLTRKNDRHIPLPGFSTIPPANPKPQQHCIIQGRMRLSMRIGGLIAKPEFSLPLLPSLLQLALGPRASLAKKGNCSGEGA